MAVSKKDLQCTIGKNIRDARKTCGYTKEVLAEKAEISVEHMFHMLRFLTMSFLLLIMKG